MARKAKQTTDERGKKELIEITPKVVREYANDLRSIAEEIDKHAAKMEALEIPKMNVLVGKWRNAVETLENWISKQFLTSMIVAARDRGHKVRDVDIEPVTK